MRRALLNAAQRADLAANGALRSLTALLWSKPCLMRDADFNALHQCFLNRMDRIRSNRLKFDGFR
jgi:hypothetical protein